MRTRAISRVKKTIGGADLKKINKIIFDFPLLHAYGVGFDIFRSIPEQTRSKAIDYARYMLAFELDDEIDAAIFFIKAIGAKSKPRIDNYVRCEYLLHLYKYWRKGTEKYPRVMPIGVFCLAALYEQGKVRIVQELKPNFLVAVSTEKRRKIENYLEATQGFQRWPEEKIFWSFEKVKDDRGDEQEN